MPTRLLEHVSVWIDARAGSAAEAFPHAMQWSRCLGLPLRVVVTSVRYGCNGLGNDASVARADDHEAPCAPLVETMKAWSAACADQGIVLETSFWVGGSEVGMARCLRPCGLCVVAERQYEHFRQELIAGGGHAPAGALLLCSPRRMPVERIAVFYEQMNPNAAYLETAIYLCQALGIRPSIVTTARTIRGGRLRRSHAEGVCASLGVAADFAGIVGADTHSALRRLLQEQQHSHLVIARADASAVWPRLHGDWLAPWRGLSDALNILALPETLALDIPLRLSHA